MTTLTRQWFGTRALIDTLKGVGATAASAERVIDLRGETHTVGEIHLDIQDHFYTVQNGTLADADILIGPRVDGRRVTFRNVNLRNVSIECADELAIEVSFIDCNGLEKCRINADQITITNCRMVESTELNARSLVLEDCWAVQSSSPLIIPVAGDVRVTAGKANPRTKLRNVDFKGDNGRLMIHHASPRECMVSGEFEFVSIHDSDLENCRLVARASSWQENGVTHRADDKKSGIWAAEVKGELVLKEVDLAVLTVDSEVIANQCEDRSSVDLQHAFVDNEWEVLRDNYSGTLLAFHLLFLLAFIAPLMTKILLAAGAAGASSLAITVPLLQEQKYETMPLWEVLLFGFYGMHSVIGWIHAVLTVALLIYNLLRVYLTVTIVKLRSREEHLSMQRFRRARPAAHKYTVKSLVHRFLMKPLLFLAVTSALWKLWDAVQMQVPIIPTK
jgi:hypothetical protein